jgi:hypothetical protein
MRTLTEKYNGVLKGTFSKDQFLKEARMQHPNLVTQHNSYQDAISILKNRGTISEISDENSSYEQAMEEAERISTEEGVTQHVDDLGNGRYGISDWYDSERTVATFERGIRVNEVKRLSETGKSYRVSESKKALKEANELPHRIKASMGLDQSLLNFLKNIYSRTSPEKIPADIKQKIADLEKAIVKWESELKVSQGGSELSEAGKSYKVSKDAIEVSQLKKGDVLKASGAEIVAISAGAKTPSGKMDVTVKYPNGKEETKQWGKSTKVTIKPKEAIKESVGRDRKGRMGVQEQQGSEDVFTDYTEASVKAKSISREEEGVVYVEEVQKTITQYIVTKQPETGNVVMSYKDGKPLSKVTESYEIPKPELPINSVERGIRFELNKKGLDTDCTVDEYVKAKKTATKNLEQDLLYYSREEGAKDMPVSKTDQMVKVKLKEGVKNLIRKVLAEGNTPKRTFTVKGKLK